MTAELLPTLRALHLLDGFPDDLLLHLSAITSIAEFPAGAVIFRQGDAASTIHLVSEGRVALEICAAGAGCRRILTVAQGELLGWSPLLGHARMTATARTLVPTKLVTLEAAQLMTVCEQHPRFGFAFMQRAAAAIAQRLNATRLQLLDVYGGQMGSVPAGDR